MATIINKRTPAIMANRRQARGTGITFVTISQRGLYISKPVAVLIKADKGKFIHFINEQDYWAFYVNNDKDGFSLNPDKDGSFMVNDRALAAMFIKSTGKKPKDRLFVIETKARHNDYPVFEIFTKDTVEFVINREKRIKEQRKKVLQTRLKSVDKMS